MPRARAVAAIAVALVITATACERTPDDDQGKLAVVASFYPLAEAAQRVGGDLLGIRNLTPPGVEPHDLELAPDDLEALVTADVVIYLGSGFQPAVEDGVAQAEGITVDGLAAVGPLRSPPPGEEAEELSADPHVWLDPARYSEIVHAVAEALARADPGHAAEFRSNAQDFESELATLGSEYREGLTSCARTTIVTSHAAFGYLADAYGMQQVPIAGLSPEAEPDPARLAELKTLVESEGITTIFTEELLSPKVAETLADEAGVTTAVLNPLEGLTPDEVEAGEDYVSVMRQNLETLRDALGCP
jgi:zinc transport system substrate-binding protein